MRPPANPLPGHHLVDAAIAWIDAATHHLDREDASLRAARGRVLTEDIRAVQPIPTRDRAALDGFAVQASGTSGASV
jgi:molybdopterin molybdotransferase